MNYSREVKAIFEKTLAILERDSTFDRSLLEQLQKLYANSEWQNENALTEVINQFIQQERK